MYKKMYNHNYHQFISDLSGHESEGYYIKTYMVCKYL